MTTKPYTREEAEWALDRMVVACAHSFNVSQAATTLRGVLTLGDQEFSSGEKICLQNFIDALEGNWSHRDPEEYYYDQLLLAQDVAGRHPEWLNPWVADMAFRRGVRYFRARGE